MPGVDRGEGDDLPARAERLAADLAPFDTGGALAVVPEGKAGKVVRSARLLVNATPLGGLAMLLR